MGRCKIRLWKEVSDSVTKSTLASTRQTLGTRLNSGLTGMQAIALGIFSMISWNLLVLISKVFLDMGGISAIGNKLLQTLKVLCFPSHLHCV